MIDLVDKQAKEKKKKKKNMAKKVAEEKIKSGEVDEEFDSSNDEDEDPMVEATKTWELGTLLGVSTPARDETIKAIVEIRWSARLASKSKYNGM